MSCKVDWLIQKPKIKDMKKEFGLSDLTATILHNRNIRQAEEIELFLDSSIDKLLDPALLKGASEAAGLIRDAINKKVPITIYGDYDVDGCTSIVFAVEVLTKLGAKVDYYINDRFTDGYGMCIEGVKKIAQRGNNRLLITVDNGIMGHDAVEYARKLGMTVIVTDHHETGETLPNANAVVNPKQKDCNYPFKGLAGCGVIFKIISHLAKNMGAKREVVLRSLDIVALGTVADLVPLNGENRVIVKNGLKLMNWGDKTRTAFKALKKVCGCNQVDAHFTLAYIFAPIINAEGRLDGSTYEGIKLLLSKDFNEAIKLAAKLKENNNSRKQLQKEQVEFALKQCELLKEVPRVIVLHNETFHHGIIGLIASKLKEKFHRPSFIFADDKDGILKGSARSIEGFDLKGVLDEIADDIVSYGGHEMAAGLSVRKDKLYSFNKNINKAGGIKLTDEDLIKTIKIDMVLKPDDISFNMIDELKELEPWGKDFESPLFLLENLKTNSVRYMGDEKQHLKLINTNIECLCWDGSKKYKNLGEPEIISAVGYPEINSFNGTKKIQFKIIGNQFIKENIN